MNISPPRKSYRDSGNGSFNPVLQPSQENLVPDEYKLNSKMVNKMVKQNKEFQQELRKKDQEIEKLTVLCRSLRDKLAKYTKLNSELQEELDEVKRAPRRETPSHKERHQHKEQYEEKERHLYEHDHELLEKLRALVDKPKDPSDELLSKLRNLFSERNVREEDILISESEEMLALKRRVDELKRKLDIKKQNQQRKYELQQEVESLLATLENPRTHSHGKRCDECHSPGKSYRDDDVTVDKYGIW